MDAIDSQFDRLSEILIVSQSGLEHTIGSGFRVARGWCCCRGRDKDWHDWQQLTRLMEVFQVEVVVPDLLNRSALKCCCTHLKFQHKHDRANDDHSVDAAPHSWNVEFQKDAAR